MNQLVQPLPEQDMEGGVDMTFDAATYRLPDGATVRIRPVRPTDAGWIAAGFEHLSDRTRTLRFLSPKRTLTSSEVRYLTLIDHCDHEALAAIDRDHQPIAVARYVRDPSRPDSAEVAIVVTDEWQGRGVGTVLLNALHERAVGAHISRFTGLVLNENRAVKHLVRHLHGMAHWGYEEDNLLGVEIALAPVAF
jgi:GNAT superfamily N-acetyltransferase